MADKATQATSAPVSGDDVVVTAQRRSERLVDVPISVNAVSTDEMDVKQINSVFDLGKSVTSLRFEGQAPVFMPTLRGIGTLVIGGALDASVPVYLDGAYLPNTRGMNFDLPNVNGMQVLKGPQGTLFGRNSTGGAILITTSGPSDTLTGRFKVGYGEFNDLKLSGYLSGPISDNIAAGLAVSYRHSNGYTKNIVTGSNNDAPARMFDIRPDIRFTNNDGFSLRLIYEHSYAFDATALGLNNPDGYALLVAMPDLVPGTHAIVAHKPWETAADLKPVNRNVGDSGLAIIDWEISDSLKLKNTVNYRHDRNDFAADADQSDIALVHVGGSEIYKTFSNELTVNGKNGNLDWVSGVYYYNGVTQDADPRNLIFGVSTPGNLQRIKTQTFAVFVDGTYEVTPGLFLTAGGRYSTERKDIRLRDGATGDPVALPNDEPSNFRWNSFTPRAAIRYQIDAGTNVYASYSRGYKTGTYAGSPPLLVRPEHINAYEIGFKHSSPMFTMNAATFYYDYKDMQVSAVDVLSNQTKAVNAEKARTYGAELEMTFHPIPAWRLSVSGAYLNAKFTRFDNAPYFEQVGGGSWQTVARSANDTWMPRSPKWTANIATSYDIDIGSGIIQFAANANASSKLYNVASEEFPLNSYAEVGANVSYTTADKHWRAEFYVTNLTNNARPVQLQGGPVGTYAIWAPPRTVGGSLSYNF
ncbi:TonB-dependent receptor [Sphingomonas sp. CL5.1]|uniref:TonB-dependent receptor n=1 Tax=Sphingomonas sp. CL5.1 TaxID=2653203 RepID=UPI001584178D|nr:TonB-dependent receptor [Sphingomonas sp. CL5.1]QKS01110.1 TonB-dependent receptor [Sphingomonas sp. CL5.1]